MTHGYETGRLDLPFTGICTFARSPYVPGWHALDCDVAVLGAPFDGGTQWRPGARFGPRTIREASTLFSFGHAGAYDHEEGKVFLGPDVRIADMGDADIVHTDTETSHANIRAGVEAALRAGALPVVLGATTRSTSLAWRRWRADPATSCRSTPISTSWTCAMASPAVTATRCAGRPRRTG